MNPREAEEEARRAVPTATAPRMTGQRRSTGLAPPKQLTTKQRRIVGALVEKHGHDIAAMSRDIKLNKMQHTVAKLRELVVSYVAYPELLQEGGGYLGFRAPKKRSLKARF